MPVPIFPLLHDHVRTLRRRRQRQRHWRRAGERDAFIHPTPLFCLGDHGSGADKIAARLADHSGVRAASGMDTISALDVLALQRGYSGWPRFLYRHRLEFSGDILWAPFLTLEVQAIQAHFPAPQMLLVVRDPRISIDRLLDHAGLGGLDLSEAATRAKALWVRPLLAGQGLPVPATDPLDNLIARWRTGIDNAERAGEDVQIARYEDLGQPQAIARLAEQLLLPRPGTPVSRDARPAAPVGPSDHAHAAGNHSSLDPSATPVRALNAAAVARIEDSCADLMDRFHYPQRNAKA